MSNSSRRGYTLDLAHQTLTLSASFADAMNDLTSAEYQLVRQFKHDFPRLTIVRKTHKTPTRYRNSDGSVTSRNKHSGLTYEYMERFILALPPKDDTDYLEAFYDVREKAEKMCASPYDAVSKWFMKQFPKFRSNPLVYIDHQPDIIDFSAVMGLVKKPAVVKAECEEKGA